MPKRPDVEKHRNTWRKTCFSVFDYWMEREELIKNCWSALKFFYGYSFMRGVRGQAVK